ncbi:MAG: c-type cytochrome [bacterium]|jgi:cytochrome c2
MFKRDIVFVWLFAVVSLAILGWVVYLDFAPGYLEYQVQFRNLVADKLGPEKAAAVPRGVQQIWVKSANRVDRCISCHQGVTWKGLEEADQPFRTHPPEPLANHPIEKFGCTLCHGGQGFATELPDAHGWVEHWEDPLLDTTLSEEYGMDEPYGFVQMKCNVCHRYDKKTEGADLINRAKELVNAKGCRACHTINGRGGTIGPDLTKIGEKTGEQYDYSRLTTFPSVFAWQVGHLQDPKSYSPDTVMPDFGFDSKDAQALSLLLLSWREEPLPAELLPGAKLSDKATPEEAEKERLMREGEGKFFVEKTCFICHDVSSLGIESATKIGPDLAIAVEDAPRRFGVTLDEFLMNPTGTMSVVLSKQIVLTDDEKREAIRLLKVAHEKHVAAKAANKGLNPEGESIAPPGN